MAELDAGHRALLADEVDAALEAGDELVVPDAEIADRAAAAPLDLGRFHDHQPGPAVGIAAGIHQVPVGGEALVGGIFGSSRLRRGAKWAGKAAVASLYSCLTWCV